MGFFTKNNDSYSLNRSLYSQNQCQIKEMKMNFYGKLRRGCSQKSTVLLFNRVIK